MLGTPCLVCGSLRSIVENLKEFSAHTNTGGRSSTRSPPVLSLSILVVVVQGGYGDGVW